MSVTLRELVERRVPQYLAIYLGAGWGIIEFTSFLEQRYSLSPAWTDIALFSWALLIPSVLLFTYNHGRRGRDRWGRSTLIGIPLNLVVAIVVLSTAFSGRELGATTTSVTVTDETGNEVERRIARSAFRKRVAIFYFDAEPADTAVAWLREGAPLALATDLAQDIFVDIRLPANFREQLREAGLGDGHDVPLVLKRRIADELHLPYFITGSVSRGIEGTTVRLATYETATGELVRERVSTGPNVLPVIDELSGQVKQDLGLPAVRPDEVTDLPVVELLSAVPGAFRALAEGQIAATRDDWAAAEAAFARAAELDGTFATAHYALFSSRLLQGKTETAIPALDAAMQHLYRMPERAQFLVKADHYFMRRDMEKAFAVVSMMVELYPDDLQGHLMLSQFQVFRDDREGAAASLRRVLELDPQQQELLLQIGDLEEQQARFADALATYGDYAERFPNDVTAQLRLARVHARTGELEAARAALDRALVIEPNHVEATTELAELDRNQGNFDDALRLLEHARASARTAEDRTRVAEGFEAHHEFRGQAAAAIEAMQERVAAAGQWQPPVTVLAMRMSQLGAYVRAGQAARAAAMLEELRGQFSGPLSDFWRLGQLSIAIAARDTLVLPEAAEGVKGIMEAFSFRFLRATLERAEATLYEARGDWQGALAAYERERQLEPASKSVHRHIARCNRQLGRPAEALRAIEEHLRSVPFSPESNIEAGRIKLLMADTAGARSHIERASLALAEADAGYPAVEDLLALRAELGGQSPP